MKLRYLILLTLLTLLTLLAAACVTPAPPAATATSAPAYPAAQPSGAYPPAQPAGAYPPASSAPAVVAKPGVLYPDLGDGAQVSWERAIAMISNNEVTKVMQTHDLKVFLTLKDGRTLMTVESKIDDIVNYLKLCGDPCKNIAVATE